ncbi:unnamed protein product [Orchesella dallaii]|uniref:F-box domain-containing protein n=1 Tax=Orchesella dallaii TaxID=48710 RepID=A0ABP1R6N2_9HEXA
MATVTRSMKINQKPENAVELDGLPNEVLQHIFDMCETKSELLNHRMVCRRWAYNVFEVLKMKTNAQFRKWNPIIKNPDRNQFFPQKIMIAPSTSHEFSDREVMFPHYFTKDLHPFPMLSVQFVLSERESGSDPVPELNPGEIKFGLLPLLRIFGETLKTLSLETSGMISLKIQPSIMFAELPNLTSVKMRNCSAGVFDIYPHISNPDSEVGDMYTTLKNLSVRGCGDYLTNWLLQYFSPDLETLELEGVCPNPFVKERYSDPDAFQKLQSLKLFHMENSFHTEEGHAFELKYLKQLSITFYLGTAKKISQFIYRHRETLTELSYNREMFDGTLISETHRNKEVKQIITFPLIKKVCMFILTDAQNKHDTEMITKCFPNLRILQLAFYHVNRSHMHDLCQISDPIFFNRVHTSIELRSCFALA